MENNEKVKLVDDEHLKLLSYAHLIDGCITIGFSCFFILHFILLIFVSGNPEAFNQGIPQQPGAPTAEFFQIFAYVLGSLILLGILYGTSKVISYRFIKNRKHRMFSFIVAIPGFIFIPYGTILGIATVKVLGRESVKDQYKTSSL